MSTNTRTEARKKVKEKRQPFVFESGAVPTDHPLYGCEPSEFCFDEVVTDSVLLAEYEAMLDSEQDRKDGNPFLTKVEKVVEKEKSHKDVPHQGKGSEGVSYSSTQEKQTSESGVAFSSLE